MHTAQHFSQMDPIMLCRSKGGSKLMLHCSVRTTVIAASLFSAILTSIYTLPSLPHLRSNYIKINLNHCLFIYSLLERL